MKKREAEGSKLKAQRLEANFNCEKRNAGAESKRHDAYGIGL